MTPPPQPEYIITEEQIKKLMNYTFDGFTSDKELEDSKEIFINIRSRPYQSSREEKEKILDKLIEMVDFDSNFIDPNRDYLLSSRKIKEYVQYLKDDIHQTKAGERNG